MVKAPNTNPGHITEFTNDPADGHRLNGTCNEAALEEAEAMASGGQASVAGMVRIYHDMRNHGQADYNGASTLWDGARQVERDGFKIALEWDYSEPFQHDWHQVLLDNAGKKAIVIQLANGQALTDIETGVHDEVGLHYHFICVLDKQADGYRCSDGDSPEVGTRYEIYSYDTLAKAVPCGLLVLENKTVATVDISNLGVGFAKYVTDHNITSKDLTGGEVNLYPDQATGERLAAFDSNTVLYWSEKSGVRDDMSALVVVGLRKCAERLMQERDVATAQVKELEAQLAAAQNNKPSLPPELHSVLANCANLLAPFADNRNSVLAVMKELGY